jgi:DnaJ family protein C protein 28
MADDSPDQTASSGNAQASGQAQAKPHTPLTQRRFMDVVEEILQRARDEGEFDNLPGKGKPLKLRDNPYAGDKALAYDLLQNNGLLPPELERGNEIDFELRSADELIATMRHRLAAVNQASASDRRAWNIFRDANIARVRAYLVAARSKVLSFNIMMPASIHRPAIRVEDRMRAVEAELPHLSED